MANTQAFCTQAKLDFMNGLHAFGASVVRGATTKDAYKAALYFATATVNATTTVYSATGEATGTGYVATGVSVTTATPPAASGTTACFTPSASITYGVVSIAAFDALVLYNDTSSTKLAVSVHTFGSQTVVAGTLTFTMPANTAGNALVQIA